MDPLTGAFLFIVAITLMFVVWLCLALRPEQTRTSEFDDRERL